jgi:hypothetical protein
MAMDFIVLALIFHKKICFEKSRIISDNPKQEGNARRSALMSL